MIEVHVDSCLHGRLTTAYPVARHDVELRVDGADGAALTAVLQREGNRLLVEDPQRRKVVFAAPCGDVAVVSAAEDAGFRYVVDVDLGGAALSLLVLEPSWVRAVDLDRVPQT